MGHDPLLPAWADILWMSALGAVGVALAVIWVVALLQISRATLSDTARAVWVLIVLVAPFLGAIAWFAIGRPPRDLRSAR